MKQKKKIILFQNFKRKYFRELNFKYLYVYNFDLIINLNIDSGILIEIII